MAIIATAGAANANSYGTLTEADAYFANHPDFDSWDESPNQEEALIFATIQLEALDYPGDPATETQALSFPRIPNDVFTELRWTDTEIPTKLKYAQFELALKRIKDAAAGTSSSTDTLPISSLKVGNQVAVTYDTSGASVNTSIGISGLAIQAEIHLRGIRLVACFA